MQVTQNPAPENGWGAGQGTAGLLPGISRAAGRSRRRRVARSARLRTRGCATGMISAGRRLPFPFGPSPSPWRAGSTPSRPRSLGVLIGRRRAPPSSRPSRAGPTGVFPAGEDLPKSACCRGPMAPRQASAAAGRLARPSRTDGPAVRAHRDRTSHRARAGPGPCREGKLVTDLASLPH